jgi:hypothetical protein
MKESAMSLRRRTLFAFACLSLALLASRRASADSRPTYTFQAVFLVADMTAGGSLESVPANAQKALRSASSFLPYKSYRLLDAAWIRTAFKGSSRVTGPDGGYFEIFLTVDPGGKSGERIVLNEFYLQTLTKAGAVYGRPLLSTTFSMELGETVVVGTSKLDGSDKALVVLLTAVQ